MPLGFDASSFNLGCTARKFFMPGNVGTHYLLGSKNNEHYLSSMLCDCSVCQKINISDIYEDTGKSGAIISLHNLYCTIEENRIINCLADDIKNLTLYAHTIARKDYNIVNNTLSILSDYSTHGLEYVYNKYTMLFIEKVDQKRFKNLSGIK
jgi:hypothetical protein